MLRDEVQRIWPELEWIEDVELREKTTRCWERAFELSPLEPSDLERIPFTLKVPDCPVTFMAHKRAVVHIARDAAASVEEFFGEALPADMDTVIAGAILADVGKLLEYESDDEGGSRQSARGKYLRHPFTGVALCFKHEIPEAVMHVVATHSWEGDRFKRRPEAIIFHHADFTDFDLTRCRQHGERTALSKEG